MSAKQFHELVDFKPVCSARPRRALTSATCASARAATRTVFLRATLPRGVATVDWLPVGEFERVIDEPPCDFVVHLAQRLGVDREAAQATLRDWILRYEPRTAYPVAARWATGTQKDCQLFARPER